MRKQFGFISGETIACIFVSCAIIFAVVLIAKDGAEKQQRVDEYVTNNKCVVSTYVLGGEDASEKIPVYKCGDRVVSRDQIAEETR